MTFTKISKPWKFTFIILFFNGILWGSFYLYSLSTNLSLFDELDKLQAEQQANVYKENFTSNASVASSARTREGFEFNYTKSSQLKPTFAAIYFPIENLSVDFSKYERISITISVKKAKRIPVQLSIHYSNKLVRHFTGFIDIKKGVQKYDLYLSEFRTPAYWYEEKKFSETELPRDSLQKINTIAIESCHLLSGGIKDSYLIKSIIFHKDLSFEIMILAVIDLIFTLCFIYFYFKPFQNKSKIVHIPILPIQIKEGDTNISKISNFIGLNYANPDLTLSILQKELGINAQEISKEIKLAYNLSFPQYLNKIRIEESKRLLKEGKFKTIADIAYLVGFNSPNNYNRVFKSIEGTSPKQILYPAENE